MSLTAAMQIGRTALTASQLGIQITGNNLANASTPGYSRTIGVFSPISGDRGNLSIGRGVQVRDVQRQIDQALQARLWTGASDEAAAQQQKQILTQVESTLGALGDHDLSSEFTAFFNSWSERANQTGSSSVVVQQGDRLASFLHRLRTELTDQRSQLDNQAGAGVDRANQLISSIADLNRAISDAEVGGGSANPLRDQRDSAVTELSSIMDVTVVDHGSQGVDVLVGSSPIVLGGDSRGLEMRRQTVNGQTVTTVNSVADGQVLTISSGQLGALLNGRDATVNDTIGKLDGISAQLIFQINKLHSTGMNAAGLTSSTGGVAMPIADRTRALNDPANATMGGLPYHASSGGFIVHVRQTSTGAMQDVLVRVDLDGTTNAGTAGTADDTSVEQIRSALDAIPGLAASFTSDGKLKIDADSGFDFSFSDDTSGALATLGVNSYFTGTNAGDIAVRADLKADPTKLTAGRLVNGAFIENGTALAVAGLQSRGVDALNGRSISEAWRDSVQSIGVASAGAQTRADAASIVRQSLESQRDAVSGVSVDEESINLLNFQRQYQGAAKLISVADQLTQTLIDLV